MLFISNAPGLPNETEIGLLKSGGSHADAHAEMILNRLAEVEFSSAATTLVVPVPSARDPLSKSGSYSNRTSLVGPYALAKSISRKLGVPWRDELWFTRDVGTQKGKNRQQRWENVKGAMSTRSALSGEEVLLIDDVVTTCAIIFEAARALDSAGGRVPFAAAAARDSQIDFVPEHLKVS